MRSWRHPPKRETLTSNLLRITAMPEVIHLAPAAVRTYPAAGELANPTPPTNKINGCGVLVQVRALHSQEFVDAPAASR